MLRRISYRMLLIAVAVGTVLALCAGLAVAANGNGAGLQRVPVLIGFRQVPGPSEQALVRSHGGAIKYSYTLVPAIAASIPEPAIEGLRRNPNVTIVEPDIEVFAVDAELDNTWGVERIGAGTVHDGGNRGAGIKVAIIDSGVDYTHPDLNANFDPSNLGYDFVNTDTDPMDDAGHGTHVAGTVAAEDDNLGVVGVAPDADLYALKVLGANGSGSYSDIIAALQWAVDPVHGIQVTNNSYGSSGNPGLTVQTAFDNAAAKGIINVCAAGNSGNSRGTGDNVIYPARYASCIAVAATDSSNRRASFSSTGPAVELAAPGVAVLSTIPGGGYATWSGTSMACPHVAGTVALMIAAGVGNVRTQLQNTADDLGVSGRDPLYGYGLVDADEAAGGPAGPPVANFVGTPTTGTAPLLVYFTDISTGLVSSWLWEFGDGGTSTARDPSHTYSNAGSYTVSLTVTGSDSSDIATASNYITVTAPPSQDLIMHVAEILMSLKKTGPNVNAVATVTVVDGAGLPVAGATVSGHWSGATSDSDLGTTDTLGRIALQSNKIKNPAKGTTFTFTVDSVVKSGWTYDSTKNVKTSDSIAVP